MTPRRLIDRVAEWLRRRRAPHAIVSVGAPNPSALLRDFESSTLGGPGQGLDDITRLLDRWFDAEVRQLEEEARGFAQAWAAAGLPRAGVADEQLPVERILALKATEVHRKWSRLLRTKVQDGIAEATRRAGGALLEYREHVAGLRQTERELERVGAEIARLEESHEATPTPGAASQILAPWKFWALIVLLVCVDWIANVPVFQELLPKEPGADEMWQNVVARSERFPVLGGIYRSLMRVAFSPEVSLLALGVIAFLVFLAHLAGEGLRNLIALHELEPADATLGVRSHRRQFYIPVVAGGVGALCVVAVLFLAREELRRQTEARLAESIEEVRQLEASLAAARETGDLDVIGEVNARLAQARAVVDYRAQRAEYARGIQGMNVPITMLNIVLIIAAAMASYLSASDSLSRRRPIDPRLLHMQYEYDQLRVREAHHRVSARRAAIEVQDRLSQAFRLLHSRPLRDWNEKAERLRGVIETFRAENARVRGLDPVSIAAFRQPIVLDLASADEDEPFQAPPELAEIAAALRRMRGDPVVAGAVELELPDLTPVNELPDQSPVNARSSSAPVAASPNLTPVKVPPARETVRAADGGPREPDGAARDAAGEPARAGAEWPRESAGESPLASTGEPTRASTGEPAREPFPHAAGPSRPGVDDATDGGAA